MSEYTVILYGYDEDAERYVVEEWEYTDREEAFNKFKELDQNLQGGEKRMWKIEVSGCQ